MKRAGIKYYQNKENYIIGGIRVFHENSKKR